MIIFNETLTTEEATKLCKSKDGMMYPDTFHNRQIMKGLVDSHLKKLQANRDAKI